MHQHPPSSGGGSRLSHAEAAMLVSDAECDDVVVDPLEAERLVPQAGIADHALVLAQVEEA